MKRRSWRFAVVLAAGTSLGVLTASTEAPVARPFHIEDPEVRKIVLGALSSYDWGRVRPTILSHLSDPHWSVRKSAAEILKLRRDPATDLLLEQMAADNPDPTVRQAAREALGR